MKMFEEARIKDNVWSIRQGWGNIDGIYEDDPYPIKVKFENGDEESYCLDGKTLPIDLNPSLFWNDIKIVPPPRPLRLVKKKLEGWVNIYRDRYNFYKTKDVAIKDSNKDCVTCVYVSGEYEEWE